MNYGLRFWSLRKYRFICVDGIEEVDYKIEWEKQFLI